MMSDKLQAVEDLIISKYYSNGFVSEDEIVDICIDNELELTEIDAVCERLLAKGIIIRDNDISLLNGDIVDRSHLDYDRLLDKISIEYTVMSNIINEIKGIKPPQTREWQTLIASAQNSNSYAKERIVQMYLRTVLHIAYNFATVYKCDIEEAFQNGVIGLLTAIEKFDLSSPDSFVWYFPLWCRQSMWRFGNIENTIYYFPAHYKEKLYPMISLIEKYRMSEEERIDYLSSYLDGEDLNSLESDKEDLSKMLISLMPAVEISEEILVENLMDCYLRDKGRLQVINELLETLDERERKIIILRYGMRDGISMTLEEVGTLFNVTRERIRQIETKALKKMRIRLNRLKIFSAYELS